MAVPTLRQVAAVVGLGCLTGFAGLANAQQITTAPLSFFGQNTDGRFVATPGLMFYGQNVAPLQASPRTPLVFHGQTDAAKSAVTATLTFTGQDGPRITSAVQLFDAVPRANTDKFKGNPVGNLIMGSKDWEPIPYRMTGDFNGTVTVPAGATVTLAGDAQGQKGYEVDNFLLLQIGSHPPVVMGATAPVLQAGRALERLGPGGYGHAAGVIDLTEFFQPGVPTPVRAMALDYGGVGYVSNVYLVTTSGG